MVQTNCIAAENQGEKGDAAEPATVSRSQMPTSILEATPGGTLTLPISKVKPLRTECDV